MPLDKYFVASQPIPYLKWIVDSGPQSTWHAGSPVMGASRSDRRKRDVTLMSSVESIRKMFSCQLALDSLVSDSISMMMRGILLSGSEKCVSERRDTHAFWRHMLFSLSLPPPFSSADSIIYNPWVTLQLCLKHFVMHLFFMLVCSLLTNFWPQLELTRAY